MQTLKKIILFILFFLVFFLITGFLVDNKSVEETPVTRMQDKRLKENIGASVITASLKNEDDSVIVGWVGDIAPALSKNEGNTSALFSRVTDYLKAPDIMLGNLEGTLAVTETPKCDEAAPQCYLFGGSYAMAESLSDAGFDGLNIANNHAYDFGKEGFLATKEILDTYSLMAIGGKNDIRYSKAGDTTVAFVGASSYYWSPSLIDTNDLARHIKEADKNADIVIVLFHGGSEGRDYAHVPMETEWYMGENRGDLRMVARRAIDEGADAVLGSGPHVLRGIEFYKKRIIAYSLGNFAFSGTNTISQRDSLGTSAVLTVSLSGEGEYMEGMVIPIAIDYKGMPEYDESRAAIEIMHSLSQEDFGPSGALIKSDGSIHIPAN